jgi:hypothetical protein
VDGERVSVSARTVALIGSIASMPSFRPWARSGRRRSAR